MRAGANRRAVVAGLLAGLAGSAAIAQPSVSPQVTVLTVHPATSALAAALTAGTSIRVHAVQPAALPATRLTSFLAGRGAKALAAAAVRADAVITMRSFWPDDPLYPHARRANIRIIEIDAGRPLDGTMPGIAVADPADASAFYAKLGLQPMPANGEASAPWLAPSGLGRMADVLAGDLERLAPSAETAIAANLAALKRRLITAKAKADRALSSAPSVTAFALSPHFGYLANDLGLDLVASIVAVPNEWTPERARVLEALLKDNAVAVVLLDGTPNASVTKAITDAGAKPLMLALVKHDTTDPVGVVEANLAALAASFANGEPP